MPFKTESLRIYQNTKIPLKLTHLVLAKYNIYKPRIADKTIY